MLKINYNDKTYSYNVFIHPDKNLYAVKLTDDNAIPIEIIKDVLEEQYNIKIKQYNKGCNISYEKENFVESGEFFYYFKVE